MKDLLKLVALVISILSLCLYVTFHVHARAPDLEPDLSAILSSLESAHVIPFTIRYGSPTKCEADTQTIVFHGQMKNLQKDSVYGIICCHGNFCFIQHLEVSQ